MVQIRKARRSATKLRLLLTGPSGSGKTWGGLQIAKGLGGRTVVIDTEEGSSDLYDTLHDFDVIDLRPPFSPEAYIEAITAAEQAGYDVIIVDSVTHCWSGSGGCLEILEDVAKAQFRGNTWSAFSVITPRWRAFVDKLLRSPAHIICSGRSKTETAQVDDHGKKKVAKLGMKLEARDGLEFEFTVVLDLIHDGHYATVSKDRTGLFAGDPKPITVDTGKRIAAWLAGAQPADPPAPAPAPAPKIGWLERVNQATTVEQLGQIGDDADRAESAGELTPTQRERLDKQITIRHEQLESAQPPALTAPVQMPDDPAGRARLAVSRATTFEMLDAIRTLVDKRHGEGVFTDAVKTELVNLIHHKAEMLIGDSDTEHFDGAEVEAEARA